MAANKNYKFSSLSTKKGNGLQDNSSKEKPFHLRVNEEFNKASTSKNLPGKSLLPKSDLKIDENLRENSFDAFQSYLNDDDILKASQFSQLLQSTQVLKQIDNVVRENTNQVPPSETNELKQNKISSAKLLSDLFDDRQDFERFFNQVEHSISIMGTDQDTPSNDNIVEAIDVLFSVDNEEIPNLDKKPLDWINESFNASMVNSTINSSFGSAMRKVLLANASKDVSLVKEELPATVTQPQFNFTNLGPFYGLPLKVKELIKTFKGIENLYDWQDECLNLPAIREHSNLIYALPTSGGKTLVAEILILREILCYKRNALFILPFVAIVQEKVWALSPFAVALDFLVEEYAASKGIYPPRKRRRKNSVYIATIEKALGLLNSLIETGRIHELGLIVVDELHLIGEQGRGSTLEGLLTKIRYINADTQIVGMSATIGNINDICQFLKAQVYTQNFRPVELVEYVKCGPEIAEIKWGNDEDDLLSLVRTVDFEYAEAISTIDPDRLGGLVMEVIPQGSCLIFCASKKNCENVAYLLCRVVNKKLTKYKAVEKEQVKEALKDEAGSLCKIFNVSIQFGIAYHHSGLTNEERRVIEDAFRSGIISVICCTSTLAAGVNLPAKRVILRQPYIGRDFINLSRYKQMVGRAGRAGLGETGESILICTPQDLPKIKKLFLSPMDRALSNMHHCDSRGLRHLLLSCVSLGIANTRLQLQQVASKTLLAFQSSSLEVDVRRLTDKAISDLFKLGALQEHDVPSAIENYSPSADISVRMDTSVADISLIEQSTESRKRKRRRIVIRNDTKFIISKLGCAAIKGNFELTRAHMLYDDLHQAQRSLVLLDALHLLYLVTPYDIAEQIRPDKTEYYKIFCKLGKNELQTAKIIGIDESVVTKLLTNQQIKTVSERVLNRFYLTLMLYDLWNEKPVFEVSDKFQVDRGVVQNLMTSAATFATNVVNFCEGLDEFWTFAHLLKGMSQRLSHCCVRELVPLMELPAVKQSRAKQLYAAGYKTLQSIAKAKASDLMEQIEFMPKKVAKQLIAAAKMLLLEKVENLREEAEDVLEGVENNKPLVNQSIL